MSESEWTQMLLKHGYAELGESEAQAHNPEGSGAAASRQEDAPPRPPPGGTAPELLQVTHGRNTTTRHARASPPHGSAAAPSQTRPTGSPAEDTAVARSRIEFRLPPAEKQALHETARDYGLASARI